MTNDKLTELFQLDEKGLDYSKLIDSDLHAFKNYCDNMKTEEVKDLFKLKESELHFLKNDNLG